MKHGNPLGPSLDYDWTLDPDHPWHTDRSLPWHWPDIIWRGSGSTKEEYEDNERRYPSSAQKVRKGSREWTLRPHAKTTLSL